MGVFVHSRLVQSYTAWIKLYTVYFDGETYDYLIDVGDASLPESQVEATIKRQGGDSQVLLKFLRDVELKVDH